MAPISLEFFHYDVAVMHGELIGERLELDEMGNLSTRRGDPITIRYSVVDLGSEEANDVTVRLYHTAPNGTRMVLDESLIDDLSEGSAGLSYRWDAQPIGLHRFEVVLTHPDQSDTSNDVWTVEIEVVRPPPVEDGVAIGGAEVGGILVLLVGVIVLALAVRGVRLRPDEGE